MIDLAKQKIREAKSIAVLTGAGISAESGISTFRDAGGMWDQYNPRDLASLDALKTNPTLVWQWYNWRRGKIAAASPNPGHTAIAKLEAYKKVTLITQNVDGLHDLAGSTNPIKLHGDIWNLQCTQCPYYLEDRSPNLNPLPPLCMACGQLMRPGVVFFKESLSAWRWDKAELATRTCDVFLVVGTSSSVAPAAWLIPTAKRSGTFVIEVNTGETPYIEYVDIALKGKAGEILPQLVSDL